MKATITGLRRHTHYSDNQGGVLIPDSYANQRSLYASYLRKNLIYGAASRWKAVASASADQWRAIEWSSEKKCFVAVSIDGTIQYSNDGISWVNQAAATAACGWHGLVWAKELGLFVAVASSGASRIMTSPDGIAWTDRAAPENNQWRNVCWSPQLRLLVATAIDGANRVMYSRDGINWFSAAASAANAWEGVCWSPELGLFVAVASSGANRIMYSRNGINWTGIAAPEDGNNWRDVAWSSELGLFVAVAYSGANRIMQSPTGIGSWLATAHPTADQWVGIRWIRELGLFVINALDGALQIASSIDGSAWRGHRTTSATQWNSRVAYSPEYGLMIAVAMNGVTNRSARLDDLYEESIIANAAMGVAAGQYGDLTSVRLPAGTWDIETFVQWIPNGATTTTFVYSGMSVTSGNSGVGLVTGDSIATGNFTSGEYLSQHVFKRVTIAVPAYPADYQDWYLKIRADTSIANLNVAGKITARRII